MTDPWNLGEREAQILSLVRDGGSNKEAARSLGLSIRTIETYLLRAYSKMKVANRVQAAVAYDRWSRKANQAQEVPRG